MKNKKYLAAVAAVVLGASSMLGGNPTYPGGEDAMNKFISENMNYPARALDNGIEGIVIVRVSVDANGNITDAKNINSIDPDLEMEAVRIVKNMKGWIPPVENGKAAPSSLDIKVIFTLS